MEEKTDDELMNSIQIYWRYNHSGQLSEYIREICLELDRRHGTIIATSIGLPEPIWQTTTQTEYLQNIKWKQEGF